MTRRHTLRPASPVLTLRLVRRPGIGLAAGAAWLTAAAAVATSTFATPAFAAPASATPALAAPEEAGAIGPLAAPPLPAPAAVGAGASPVTSPSAGTSQVGPADSAVPSIRRWTATPPLTTSLPLWELGIGAAGLTLPDYRGAAHKRHYLLPVPYVIYRGAFLRADREGARAVLLDSNLLDVDISVAGTPPSRSEPDGPRAGMPDLEPTFEIGPNVNVTLWRDTASNRKLHLRLPVRAAIGLHGGFHNVGTTFDPKLNFDINNVGHGWRMGMQLGALNGSKRYHQRIYSVSPEQATASRPAYEARGGRAGWQVLVATSRRFENFWVGGFLRHDTLGNASFVDSPLVQRRHTWTGGLGVAWVFARSSRMVDVVER